MTNYLHSPATHWRSGPSGPARRWLPPSARPTKLRLRSGEFDDAPAERAGAVYFFGAMSGRAAARCIGWQESDGCSTRAGRHWGRTLVSRGHATRNCAPAIDHGDDCEYACPVARLPHSCETYRKHMQERRGQKWQACMLEKYSRNCHLRKASEGIDPTGISTGPAQRSDRHFLEIDIVSQNRMMYEDEH